jgi:hypothetical protein
VFIIISKTTVFLNIAGGYSKSSELPIHFATSSWTSKKYLISADSALSLFTSGTFPTVRGDTKSSVKYQPIAVDELDASNQAFSVESVCLEAQADDANPAMSDAIEVDISYTPELVVVRGEVEK